MTDAEKAELAHRFDEVGRGVTAALDTIPTMEPGWWHQVERWVYGAVTMYHPTGLALRLEHARYNDEARGRLTVHGVMPLGWSGDTQFTIGVSIGRAPQDIARDIHRRLLPDYMAALPGALAEVADTERLRLSRTEAMRTLTQALPALHTYDWDREQSAGSFHSESRHHAERAYGYGTVRVNHGAESADLKLTGVPLNRARAILAILHRPPATPATEPADDPDDDSRQAGAAARPPPRHRRTCQPTYFNAFSMVVFLLSGRVAPGRQSNPIPARKALTMSKLPKDIAKLHQQAQGLVDLDRPLTHREREFVLDHWQESSTASNSLDGAFFTPPGLAAAFTIETTGPEVQRVLDLCAGIGRLAWSCMNDLAAPDREMVCVERNPLYVEVGRKVLPEARWICADIFDLPSDLGRFDMVISNPPYGFVERSGDGPGVRSRRFEYHALAVAAELAECGVFLIPQESAPFRFSGVPSYREVRGAGVLRLRRAGAARDLRPRAGACPRPGADGRARPRRHQGGSDAVLTPSSGPAERGPRGTAPGRTHLAARPRPEPWREDHDQPHRTPAAAGAERLRPRGRPCHGPSRAVGRRAAVRARGKGRPRRSRRGGCARRDRDRTAGDLGRGPPRRARGRLHEFGRVPRARRPRRPAAVPGQLPRSLLRGHGPSGPPRHPGGGRRAAGGAQRPAPDLRPPAAGQGDPPRAPRGRPGAVRVRRGLRGAAQ
ncbi:hypothetical protein ACWDRR_26185 [Kitasatospora sp. NPDC003701]